MPYGRVPLVAGLLGALVLLAARTTAAAEPAPPRCDGAVDAHAVDAVSHEPLAGVVIRVDGRVVGRTDAGGHARVAGLCPGPWTVLGERAGFLAEEATVAGSGTLELALFPLGEAEVIEVEADAPPPVEVRSTAVLDGVALRRTRGRALSDALAEVPGVAQLRTASGVSKPIVRGQQGRRLALVVDGVRHRAQQWGLDHAPEVDPFAADRLTVVRGADGVRFGSDAVGGAVLVDPPALPTRPGVAGELHLIGSDNGRGAIAAGRIQGASARAPGLGARIQGSVRRSAALETPAYPLDNTGQGEWNLGGALGLARGDDRYQLAVSHHDARLGVCTCQRIDALDDFRAQLAQGRPIGVEAYTAELAIERPSQAIRHDLVLARVRHAPTDGVALTATYGFQHDLRREYDIVRSAVQGPQFRFRLDSHDLELVAAHRPLHLAPHWHLRGSAGLSGLAQVHRYQGLPLVPDHDAWAGGLQLSERLIGHAVEVELGLRYEALARTARFERTDFLRLVRAGQLAMDACGPERAGRFACASRFQTWAASLGAVWQVAAPLALKAELSTVGRPPDPDEQFLDGAAPSLPVLGLGKPDLGPEWTSGGSLTASLVTGRVRGELSVYGNRVDGYVGFGPAVDADGQPIFDVLIRGVFPRFVTRAVDARRYGGDGALTLALGGGLELTGQAALVRAAERGTGAPLAYTPPDRARAEVRYRRARLGPLTDLTAAVAATRVRRQRQAALLADLAPAPAPYTLVDAELALTVPLGGRPVELALAASNLLDATYRDYTSLLRYFADQPGRALMVRMSLVVPGAGGP